jgi:hypothetical protein
MAVDEFIQSRIERLHRLKVDPIWVAHADLIHYPLACLKKTKMFRNAKGFFECVL